jgi:RNA polymerase sigma factor (sigma-70 family)
MQILRVRGFEAYLEKASTIPQLSSPDYEELLQQRSSSDSNLAKRAKETMVAANLKQVIDRADHFVNLEPDVSFEELVQEGNIGLCKAVEAYQPGRGYDLPAYAGSWIDASIRSYISNSSIGALEVLDSVQAGNARLSKAMIALLESGELPTEYALARHLNISEEAVASLLAGSSAFADVVASADEPVNPLRDGILSAFGQLNELQRDVLVLLFNLDRRGANTAEQVSQRLSIAPQDVSEIANKSLDILRNGTNGQHLRALAEVTKRPDLADVGEIEYELLDEAA